MSRFPKWNDYDKDGNSRHDNKKTQSNNYFCRDAFHVMISGVGTGTR